MRLQAIAVTRVCSLSGVSVLNAQSVRPIVTILGDANHGRASPPGIQ